MNNIENFDGIIFTDETEAQLFDIIEVEQDFGKTVRAIFLDDGEINTGDTVIIEHGRYQTRGHVISKETKYLEEVEDLCQLKQAYNNMPIV